MLSRVRSLDPALPVLATISFVSQLGIAIMLPLLPLYGLSFGASPLQLGLMTSAFSITNASLLWQAFGVQWGLLVGSFAALGAGLVLLALPRTVSPARYGPVSADSRA